MMKRLYVAVALLFVMAVPVLYWYSGVNAMKDVDLQQLRLEILTDRVEYKLGEPFEVTVLVHNDNDYHVRFRSLTRYSACGYSASSEERIVADVSVSPANAFAEVEAMSYFIIITETFYPVHLGEYRIIVMGMSLSVNITKDDPPSLTSVDDVGENNSQGNSCVKSSQNF